NVVTALVWSSWNATGATGNGTVIIQDCNPNCAQGSQTPTPVTVTLGAVVGGYFTAMTESIQGLAPTYYHGSNWALNASQSGGTAPVAVPAPAPGDGGSGSYVQDVANAGIQAPAAWVTTTGNTLCADWYKGESVAQTD